MFRILSPYHRLKSRSDFNKRWDAPPKVSPEEIAAIMARVWSENPTVADTKRNGDLVSQFLKENHCEFTLENCRIAVKVLGYPSDQLDRQKPPVPTSPSQPVVVEPAKPVEVLAAWQIPLEPSPSEWQLRHASKEALRDYLKRARAQQK